MSRRFTADEKKELINNLNFEVKHRTTQLKRELDDRLEHFKMSHQSVLSRLPRQVREMSMRHFGEKYNGNIQAAVMGLHKAKFVSERGETVLEKIDKSTRKRKWVASQEIEEGISVPNPDDSRLAKNARMASPNKLAGSSTGPGTSQRVRRLAASDRTPRKMTNASRLPGSPSPQKMRPPFSGGTSMYSRLPARPPSPTKSFTHKPSQPSRAPSSATFNPSLPSNAPGYPARLPRKDESMLSVNGSPLANPFETTSKWHNTVKSGVGDENIDRNQPSGPQTLKRVKSNISIRRDPSYAPLILNGFHSRTNSQSTLFDSSQTSSNTHSRANSDSTLSSPPHTQPSSSLSKSHLTTPPPIVNASTLTRSYSVTISTKDGHLLEFDPLQTSPASLNALEGITDSAKKQAREEMGRLVQAAVEKWKII